MSVRERLEDGSWAERDVVGLQLGIDLPALGITLDMSEIYDGVAFPVGPRLVKREA